eukprot:69450_1
MSSSVQKTDDLIQKVDDEKKTDDTKQKIVICGAGNAAHVFCGLCAANPNNEVHLLSLYKTEAADFQKAVNQTDNKLLTIEIVKDKKSIQSIPCNITNDP